MHPRKMEWKEVKGSLSVAIPYPKEKRDGGKLPFFLRGRLKEGLTKKVGEITNHVSR